MDLEKLRYPIGRFIKPEKQNDEELAGFIKRIETLPERLSKEVSGLSDEKLDTPYRPDGWTVRQVVHHVADSHLNSHIRFKWTLTEDKPTIKAYFEDRWALLPDYKMNIHVSLNLLKALHNKWVYLLRALSKTELERTFIHPETGQENSLYDSIANYAWHGDHHLAHIEALKKRNNWT